MVTPSPLTTSWADNTGTCLLSHQKGTHRTKGADDIAELLKTTKAFSELLGTKKWEKLLLQLLQPNGALPIALKRPKMMLPRLDHDLKGILGMCL